MARRTGSGRSGKRSGPRRNNNDDDAFGARKRSRHLEGVTQIDPGDYDLLRKFLTDHGKIIPARLTGSSAKLQRQIKHGVRRARVMGLMP